MLVGSILVSTPHIAYDKAINRLFDPFLVRPHLQLLVKITKFMAQSPSLSPIIMSAIPNNSHILESVLLLSSSSSIFYNILVFCFKIKYLFLLAIDITVICCW